MMIDPPIDKLIDKIGCKYALVQLIIDRAHQLNDKHPDLLADVGKRAVSYAAQEIYDDKIMLVRI